MTQLFIAGVLGGLVFFVWSAISWMALPWQRMVYKTFLDENEVARLIATQAPESGIYGLPAEPKYPAGADKGQRDAIDQAVWTRLQEGPTMTAVIKRGGLASFPQMLGVALVTYVVVAILFGWMLSLTSGLSYAERVGFVSVAGLAAGVICRVPDWNWHQYPMNHTVVQIASLLIGWFLSGLVMAHFVRGLQAS